MFCSCIFFFDQCEIEAAKPKVDLAVTNRLYHYREAANPKNREQHQLALTTLLYNLLNLKEAHQPEKRTGLGVLSHFGDVRTLARRTKVELELATTKLVKGLTADPPSLSKRTRLPRQPQLLLRRQSYGIWFPDFAGCTTCPFPRPSYSNSPPPTTCRMRS